MVLSTHFVDLDLGCGWEWDEHYCLLFACHVMYCIACIYCICGWEWVELYSFLFLFVFYCLFSCTMDGMGCVIVILCLCYGLNVILLIVVGA